MWLWLPAHKQRLTDSLRQAVESIATCVGMRSLQLELWPRWAAAVCWPPTPVAAFHGAICTGESAAAAAMSPHTHLALAHCAAEVGLRAPRNAGRVARLLHQGTFSTR